MKFYNDMKRAHENSLENIKDTYGRYIDDAVIQCVNEYGRLDTHYLKLLIARIWIHQFIPASTYLDGQTIESVRLMFDEIICSLDSDSGNLEDCIALVDQKQVSFNYC